MQFRLIIAILGTAALFACHKPKIGYLRSELAEYTPDSLVVKATLDPVADAERLRLKYPWQSDAIEGVEGTFPIKFEVTDISSKDGNTTLMRESLQVAGNAVLSLPWNHKVPAGRYIISLTVSNTDHRNTIDNIFTIIVK